jgi:putative FmdB family regulatory protein
MPIYEYRCDKCGEVSEFIVLGSQEGLACKKCGSEQLTKLMSAHNVSGGSESFSPPPMPAGGGCCGSPGSCGTPGSCCGM